MDTHIRCLVGALAAAFVLVHSQHGHSQTRETDEYVARNLEALTIGFDSLEGRVDGLDEKMRLLAELSISRPEFEELVKSLTKFIKKEEGNQKQMLLEYIVALHCITQQDNCELGRRLAQLESRLNRLEGEGPQPTPADTQYVPEPPNESEAHPYAPAPPQQAPTPYIWDGSLDFVTDRRDTFTPDAVRVIRCIDYQFADGSIYHGDVYLTRGGNHVLLRHNRTSNVYIYSAATVPPMSSARQSRSGKML